jgi:hypothetical protein
MDAVRVIDDIQEWEGHRVHDSFFFGLAHESVLDGDGGRASHDRVASLWYGRKPFPR